MTAESLNDIERADAQIRARSVLPQHNRELSVVNDGLNAILEGLDLLNGRRIPKDDQLTRTKIGLVTMSFNSLFVALQTLERGYSQQAKSLVRIAAEAMLIAEDCEVHQPTLEALVGWRR